MDSLPAMLDRHLRRTPSLTVVLNPNAGRVRRDMATAAARATAEQNPRLHLTASLEQLDELFRERPLSRSETVCFYGGDGSIARGLSAMINARGKQAELPTLLPVGAGTINVMSEYLGLSEAPADTLARLHEQGRLVRRALPSLEIEVEGHAPIYGFMFGWGVGYRVLASYYERRAHPTLLDATVVMAQTFAQSLHPRATQLPLFERRELGLEIDGEAPAPTQPALHSLLVGVLEQTTMGIRPLPPEQVQAHRFHFSGNGMRPGVVFRHAPLLLFARGDQRELSASHPVVAQANVSELRFEISQGYTLDGEMISVEGERRCRISAGPMVEFWAGC